MLMFHVRNAGIDNKWVVPCNRHLLVRYQCHINVEICCHARLKYLFKYFLKGHDRAIVEIIGQRNFLDFTNAVKPVMKFKLILMGDIFAELRQHIVFLGSQYIHYRLVSVHRFSFHLPGQKNVTFRVYDDLLNIVNREKKIK